MNMYCNGVDFEIMCSQLTKLSTIKFEKLVMIKMMENF